VLAGAAAIAVPPKRDNGGSTTTTSRAPRPLVVGFVAWVLYWLAHNSLD